MHRSENLCFKHFTERKVSCKYCSADNKELVFETKFEPKAFFINIYNTGKTYMTKSKKPNKIGEDQKTLISAFL